MTHSVAGLADSIDYFEPEQHEAARARFEELGAETRTPYVDNAVVRLLARGTWLRRFVPDHDAFAGLAEDLVVVDNRSGVSLPDLHGADELVQASREQEELFGPIEIEPVAVRGDRLALRAHPRRRAVRLRDRRLRHLRDRRGRPAERDDVLRRRRPRSPRSTRSTRGTPRSPARSVPRPRRRSSPASASSTGVTGMGSPRSCTPTSWRSTTRRSGSRPPAATGS